MSCSMNHKTHFHKYFGKPSVDSSRLSWHVRFYTPCILCTNPCRMLLHKNNVLHFSSQTIVCNHHIVWLDSTLSSNPTQSFISTCSDKISQRCGLDCMWHAFDLVWQFRAGNRFIFQECKLLHKHNKNHSHRYFCMKSIHRSIESTDNNHCKISRCHPSTQHHIAFVLGFNGRPSSANCNIFSWLQE